MELANLKLHNFQYRKTIQDKSISLFFSLSKYTAVLFHKRLIKHHSSNCFLHYICRTALQPLFLHPPPPQTIRLISVLGKSKASKFSLGAMSWNPIGSRGEVTHILNLGKRWRWVVACTLRSPIYGTPYIPVTAQYFFFYRSAVYTYTVRLYVVPHTVKHSPFQLFAKINFMLNFKLCSDLILSRITCIF